MDLNFKNIKKILFIIFCGVLFFCVMQNLGSIWDFLLKIISFFSPVIAALCLAFVLNVLLVPIETKLLKFMGNSKNKFIRWLRRPVSLVLTYLIALGLLTAAIGVIIPDLIETFTYLADKLPAFIVSAREWIEDTLARFNINSDLPDIKINWSAAAASFKDMLQSSSSNIVDGAVNITTSVFNGVFDGLFSVVISVYVLAQKEKIERFFKNLLEALFPQKVTKLTFHIASETHEAFSNFIGGQCLEAFILGSLCCIGMYIFGFPNPIIISVVVGITALVPVVGPIVGVAIGFLLIVIQDPIKALLFVAFVLILQQIEGHVIYPKVVGKAVGLPGIIVISAVLVGGNLGGVLGALMAVPASAVIYTLLKEFINSQKSKKLNEKTSSSD